MAGQEACRAGTVALAAGRHLPGSRWPVDGPFCGPRAGCWYLGRDHAQQDWALFPVVLRVVDVLS
jgi:hypothetical protein